MANAKKIVDAWNAKCEKAERALDRAVKRFNEAPDHATQEQLNKLGKTMRNAQVRLQKLYDNLPYSVDDVKGEYEAQQREDKMVASGQVTPRKMKREITSEQIAQSVHRYFSNRHTLDVMHDVTLNRHEWTIEPTIGYDIAHEDIPAHNPIIGRIWVEPMTEEGEVTGWIMGYGLAKGELQLVNVNKFRLATEFRGAWRAVDNEFYLSKKWDDFVPELPKPNGEYVNYGRKGSRQPNPSYDRAYDRIVNEGMSLLEAFNGYVDDEGLGELKVNERGQKWRLFKKAMKRRRTKGEVA